VEELNGKWSLRMFIFCLILTFMTVDKTYADEKGEHITKKQSAMYIDIAI
jgi:hypothetical protein